MLSLLIFIEGQRKAAILMRLHDHCQLGLNLQNYTNFGKWFLRWAASLILVWWMAQVCKRRKEIIIVKFQKLWLRLMVTGNRFLDRQQWFIFKWWIALLDWRNGGLASSGLSPRAWMIASTELHPWIAISSLTDLHKLKDHFKNDLLHVFKTNDESQILIATILKFGSPHFFASHFLPRVLQLSFQLPENFGKKLIMILPTI